MGEGRNEGTALEVRATTTDGRTTTDTIHPTGPARSAAQDGSDRDAIPAWSERHLLGTQLGPNRNGRKW